MERFQSVLLRVWREACRHIQIDRSVATIAPMLLGDIPLADLLLWRVDRQGSSLENVARAAPDSDERPAAFRVGCSAAGLRSLLSWCRKGQVAHQTGAAPRKGPWLVALPDRIEADALVGPLGDPRGVCGLLVLVAPPRRTFTARHRALTQTLLQPFSAALANDHQLRELTALREAAEADRRSLLARLGRRKLGDTIVGQSTGLRAVMERVEQVAPSDLPVLIFGETGTGKELMARAIHERSSRAAGPVLRVNCGAIPPELIDSQLFGHERGAFTGAVEARKGWFERADGGTLFLDEIGELPPAAQVRLLRILQDGWLERVGGEHPVHVDVRIVAATHRDLAALVAEGRFREDLWYRIAVFPLVLPPLRERVEDIAELARHFAQRAATRFGLAPASPTEQDIAMLSAYRWPGNIRELAAVIDRATILGNGERLEVGMALGTPLPPRAAPARIGAAAPAPAPVATIKSLDAAMRRHVEAALAATRGRVEGPLGAAALLQINPHTLRARMRKLGIDWKRFRAI